MQHRNTTNEVRRTQVSPVAGVWVCPNCGRRIQVTSDSDVEKVQPFVCVCGTPMEPGQELGTTLEEQQGSQGGVVDG
jgi:hypothetical protein